MVAEVYWESECRVAAFGFRAGPGEMEIPSTSLRAGSSLRLKSGCAQDDKAVWFDWLADPT
jgi:hypothetical protein